MGIVLYSTKGMLLFLQSVRLQKLECPNFISVIDDVQQELYFYNRAIMLLLRPFFSSYREMFRCVTKHLYIRIKFKVRTRSQKVY